MTAMVYDDRCCVLGEGPLWHPERGQLFWFDIVSQRLLTRVDGFQHSFAFEQPVSAAGWVDAERLLIAGADSLFLFGLEDGSRQTLVTLEADDTRTRSNDGRADPWGGFWIGTMGRSAEPGLGSIYRYYQGEIKQLHAQLTIPNAICFAPDRSCVYFADTPRQMIFRQRLSDDGWPAAAAEDFIDLKSEKLNPDGAVVDAEGYLWNAQWGASRVARYSPDGRFTEAIEFPTLQISCPAFGGNSLSSLYATSATENLDNPDDEAGKTFVVETAVQGQPEPSIKL